MKLNQFVTDPWLVAKAHYERETMRFMAALMRQLGVTQVEIPLDALVQDATVEMYDCHDKPARFYRIVGELRLATPSNNSGEGK